MSRNTDKKYWLDQPGATDKVFRVVVLLAILAAIPDILALFDFVYHKHTSTDMEDIPVFYGLYAMISFLALLVVAKTVRPFLTRKEDYYD
ncbi:hypothetical protein [Sneathiella chinensis]|uniref:Holin n=1 Tax=Sneathiella chinensis TaxID=349750 RepID=A0ABQ5U5V2_9PROT|nr:hypothetical protein [Sneathiella chinensis]GLQ07093.1 hypothetical protein GCM10007924_23140 [Sneathiella chinensis]